MTSPQTDPQESLASQFESADETLLGLVKRYSPSGSEAQAVSWLVSRMQARGYGEAFVDQAGNAVGVMGDGEQQVVLLGHIDTAPGEIPVRTEGDLLYGRGAVDAKGPLATFVEAVARLGSLPGWQFVVIGAVDEERDSLGARYVVQGYQPDFVIIGEPSGWQRCTLGYKGSARAAIRFSRSQAHSASQHDSACDLAFQAWSTILQWVASFNTGRKRYFDQLLVSLGNFSSGADGFESWAQLEMNARLPLDLPPGEWIQNLNELCAPARVEPMGYAIPAYQAEKNTPLVRAFLGGIRSQGGKPGFVLKTGTADLNIVAPAWKCPAVVYGPGDSALDHTPDEHISLDEYHLAIQVLGAALRRLAGSDN